ncbi:hypothetical protein RND71_006505 [Anisodus tanguticus]|uniref:C3H1-type domain-containing protein n=1 Tax=Anisodus tanguticus TaxID=243964 RepID=A0AAE1SUC1_9SOLA|nr:hypothetical protein RND71_006505 [Anisodus tanguticus]
MDTAESGSINALGSFESEPPVAASTISLIICLSPLPCAVTGICLLIVDTNIHQNKIVTVAVKLFPGISLRMCEKKKLLCLAAYYGFISSVLFPFLYYLTEDGCKYGNACKCNHSRRNGVISPVQSFNFLGLPIQSGGRVCPYYMRTGTCKYGSNCRFHHPDPTTMAGSNPSFGYNNGGSAPVQSGSYPTGSSWSSPPSSNETAPFVPGIYPASQGIPPLSPQWNRALFLRFRIDLSVETVNIDPTANFIIQRLKYPKTNPSVLSDKGLPLRPGQAVCSFYSRYGICKFGPACKYDHPEHYDNSASSTGYTFYQPPFGNSATTDGLRMARKGNGNGNGSLIQQSV